MECESYDHDFRVTGSCDSSTSPPFLFFPSIPDIVIDTAVKHLFVMWFSHHMGGGIPAVHL